MFNLSGSELVVILLIALVVLGPEKLPEAIRRVGRIYAELRKMSSGFQEEFTSAMREPVDELRSTSQMMATSLDVTAASSPEEQPIDEAERAGDNSGANSGDESASAGLDQQTPADEPASSNPTAPPQGTDDDASHPPTIGDPEGER